MELLEAKYENVENKKQRFCVSISMKFKALQM